MSTAEPLMSTADEPDWLTLNDDLLLQAFAKLDGLSLLRSCQVCHAWRKLADVQRLWQAVLPKAAAALNVENPKLLCRKLARPLTNTTSLRQRCYWRT